MLLNKFKLFTTKVNRLRFDIRKEKNAVVYLGENISFSEAYKSMGLYRQDIARVFIPKIKIRSVKIDKTADYSRELKKNGLITFSAKRNKFATTNNFKQHFYDTSLLFARFDTFFEGNYSDLRNQNYVMNLFSNISSSLPDGVKRTIIYTIDISRPLNINIRNRKCYPFIYYMKREHNIDMYCDNFVLCILGFRNPIYIKLYEKDNLANNYPRFINFLQSIKNVDGNFEKQAEKEADNFIDEVKDVIKSIKGISVEKIKEAVEYSIKTNYTLFNSASVEIKKSDSIQNKKKALASLVLYTITKDKEKGEMMLRVDTKSPKMSNKLSNIIKKYSDEVVVDYKKESSNTTPVYENTPLEEAIDNKVPTTIFSKRKNDFESLFIEDVVDTVNSLSDKEFPLRVEEMKIQDIDDTSEIKRTSLRKIKIVMRDDLGKKQSIEMFIPKIDEHGNMLINNYKKIITNQMTLLPIYYPAPYNVKIITYYSTVHIQNDLFRGKRLYRAYIGGFKLPLSIILMFQKKDVKKVFNDFGLKRFELSAQKARNNPYFIKLSDGSNIIFDPKDIESRPEALSFYQSLKIVNFSAVEGITMDNFFDGNNLKELIIKMTGNKNSPFILELLEKELIDPVTSGILKNKGLPSKYYDLILYVAKKITDPSVVDERIDISKQRIRNVEVLNQLLYSQLMTAYNAYALKRKAGDDTAKIEFNKFKVFSELTTNQLVRIKENVSPAEQLSLVNRVTYIGPGGLKVSDAASVYMRTLHETAYGQIDPVDTPEGQMIGVSQHLSNGVILSDSRGLFDIKELSENERAGILGPGTSFTPFVENNEPTRMIMAGNQIKQALPLTNKEIPLVQTGYESVYTGLLDGDFIKKSPVDGTIIECKENRYIKIKDTKGKTHTVDLSPVDLKSGQAVNGISVFECNTEVGQKVKKGQIVAEGASIKNGIISQGSSVLAAFIDYDGYAFEDGEVVSDKIVKNKKFESAHYKKVEVFLYPDSKVLKTCRKGDKFEAGDAMFVFSNSEIYDYVDLDEDELINREINVRAPYDCEIIAVKVYPNEDINKYNKLTTAYMDFTKEDKTVAKNVGNFKIRGRKYEGIFIEIHIKYTMNLVIGDKLVNRHGCKGVISIIRPEKEMPVTPWGERVEICFNPLSTINRGIAGQVLEGYIGLISKTLKNTFLKERKNRALEIASSALAHIDMTKNKLLSKKLISNISKMNAKAYEEFKEFLKKSPGFPIVIPPFKSPKFNNIKKALTILKLKDKYKLFLPSENKYTKEGVTVGYVYLYKVEHMSAVKSSARSLSSYVPKTMQPPAGKSRSGGQRVGELDSWCLLSYGADKTISELFGPMSDDQIAKRKMLENIMTEGETSQVPSESTPTKDYVSAYLRCLLLDS